MAYPMVVAIPPLYPLKKTSSGKSRSPPGSTTHQTKPEKRSILKFFRLRRSSHREETEMTPEPTNSSNASCLSPALKPLKHIYALITKKKGQHRDPRASPIFPVEANSDIPITPLVPTTLSQVPGSPIPPSPTPLPALYQSASTSTCNSYVVTFLASLSRSTAIEHRMSRSLPSTPPPSPSQTTPGSPSAPSPSVYCDHAPRIDDLLASIGEFQFSPLASVEEITATPSIRSKTQHTISNQFLALLDLLTLAPLWRTATTLAPLFSEPDEVLDALALRSAAHARRLVGLLEEGVQRYEIWEGRVEGFKRETRRLLGGVFWARVDEEMRGCGWVDVVGLRGGLDAVRSRFTAVIDENGSHENGGDEEDVGNVEPRLAAPERLLGVPTRTRSLSSATLFPPLPSAAVAGPEEGGNLNHENYDDWDFQATREYEQELALRMLRPLRVRASLPPEWLALDQVRNHTKDQNGEEVLETTANEFSADGKTKQVDGIAATEKNASKEAHMDAHESGTPECEHHTVSLPRDSAHSRIQELEDFGLASLPRNFAHRPEWSDGHTQ